MKVNEPIIYLDMDGVCVDFPSAGIRVNQREPHQVLSLWESDYKGEFSPYKVMGISRESYWQSIHDSGEEFWVGLCEYPWFWDLYNSLNEISQVVFLTGPTYSSTCLSGKLKWLQKRFGCEFQNYIITSHKHLLANKFSILVDDYSINCDKFKEFGGHTVLFPQIWNENFHIEGKLEYTIQQVNNWYNCLKNCHPWQSQSKEKSYSA